MTPSVTLPSTLATPSRVFFSPFPPPNENKQSSSTSFEQQHSTSILHTMAMMSSEQQQKKHSIRPYEISTDLARTSEIYSKQSSVSPIPHFSMPPKRSTSLVKSNDDNDDLFSLGQYSTLDSEDDDDDDDDDTFDVVSFYYHQSTNDIKILSPSAPSSSSLSSSLLSSSSSSSSSPCLRASVSTPLLKSRQSLSTSKWMKHVSQTSGLLEKKLSKGFPFRSTLPTIPLHMVNAHTSSSSSSSSLPNKDHLPISKALYRGSPLVQQYLKSVTQPHHWDNMLQYGFPCPHSLRLPFHNECQTTCHQCAGQQRLMTLRVTLTPQHARANEKDIYKKKRKSKYPSK